MKLLSSPVGTALLGRKYQIQNKIEQSKANQEDYSKSP